MNKRELKTGMIVVTREGKEYMFFKNLRTRDLCEAHVFVGINHHGMIMWRSFNEDMTILEGRDKKFDIMRVFMVDNAENLFDKNTKRTLVWQRKEKEKKRYTYEQLKEILGTEFEVIG